MDKYYFINLVWSPTVPSGQVKKNLACKVPILNQGMFSSQFFEWNNIDEGRPTKLPTSSCL